MFLPILTTRRSADAVSIFKHDCYSIGHDILVNELFDRAINDGLSGAYNLIFREDGRLIVHPQHIAEIHQKGGLFDILTSSDPPHSTHL